jgi:hypothetical protein
MGRVKDRFHTLLLYIDSLGVKKRGDRSIRSLAPFWVISPPIG